MGRRTAAEQREYMRNYRSDPFIAAIAAWRSRTEGAALRELARRNRAEYEKILAGVRREDPRPGTKGARPMTQDQQRGQAA